MKSNRYSNRYVPGEKFTGSYFQMAIINRSIFLMIFCLLFALGCIITCYMDGSENSGYSWFTIIPFLVVLYMNYTHWRERQQGKTS